MKMEDKLLLQILEGQEVLLNSESSSFDLNETNSRTVRPLLEYLKQDIRAHLRDLQEGSTMTQEPDGLESVVGQQMEFLRVSVENHRDRLSKLEDWQTNIIGEF